MPPELAEVHDALWQDVAVLHSRWNVFDRLYGSEEAVQLLNFADPSFFADCQAVWVDHILMAVARLTDRSQSSGNENLSLERLRCLIDPSFPPGLRARVDAALIELSSLVAPVRKRRAKLLAHSDLDTRLDRVTLAPVRKSIVEAAFEKIRDIMNDVNLSYTGVSTLFRFVDENDGQALLLLLEKAREHERNERVQLGLSVDREQQHEA